MQDTNLDKDNPPAVQSISRAASILDCLSNGIGTVTDIASKCTLSKSTVHRLLKALDEAQIVSQNPVNHRYYLGPLITRLASLPHNTHLHLIINAIGEMERLSDICEETVSLSIMAGIQYIQLHEIASKHDLRVTEDGRRVRFMILGATVKTLIAQLTDKELKTIMKSLRNESRAENTETDDDVLLAQLNEIRQRGYAISYGEITPGALCLSVPITNYFTPSALSIIGPENRLQPRVPDLTEELKASAGRISANIKGIFR